LASGSGIFESGNFVLKLDSLQSGKFAPWENNPLCGKNHSKTAKLLKDAQLIKKV